MLFIIFAPTITSANIINKLNTPLMGIYRKSNNFYLDSLIQKYRNKKTTYVPKGDLGAKKSFLWFQKNLGFQDFLQKSQNHNLTKNMWSFETWWDFSGTQMKNDKHEQK